MNEKKKEILKTQFQKQTKTLSTTKSEYFTHYNIKSCETNKKVMIKTKATTISQMMVYILNKIGISDETSTYVVEYLGIKRSDIIECMTKDGLIKMKG